MAHGIDEDRWPVDPELRALQLQLARLASAWRDVDGDPIVQSQYVHLYHITMRRMIALGWDPKLARLDDSATLAESEMPRAYRQQMQGEPYTWNPIAASPREQREMGVHHPVDQDGEALDPELASLERAIACLAQEWFGAVALPARCRTVVATYHAVMERMFELGWNGLLDPDAELPDGLMPAEYIRRRGGHDDSWYRRHQKILSASFIDDCLMIDTAVGCPKYVPLTRIPGLFAATPEQRSRWQVTVDQQAIGWPELGVTVTLDMLIN